MPRSSPSSLRQRTKAKQYPQDVNPMQASPKSQGSSLKKSQTGISSADTGRQRHVALILVIICAFGLSVIFNRRLSSLPKAYALCSREGSIYTVDVDAPQVECIVVSGSRIMSVGTLGKCSLFHISQSISYVCICSLNSHRWNSEALWWCGYYRPYLKCSSKI